MAAHGQADEKDPARASVMLGNRVLDFHAVLGARQHPAVVVLSACTVGRTSDDPDGEPLGLVGSFLLKGSRYVIASLQPVPDFYMPLLITLFYQAWQHTGSPDKALAEAKRRLKGGDWYPATEALIRTHYQPIVEQVLASALDKPHQSDWQDSMIQLTHVWPFPLPYRALHPDGDQHTLSELRDEIETAQGRANMASRVLDTLFTERSRLPVAAVDTLCTWVRGFGVADKS
ncbi:CHAT domain-containing protein [Gammaproteobacteria bacterium]|nr:CHAT domain-containing protein [Gammaproteobacteria bacterium]